jgi:hypothetical protein
MCDLTRFALAEDPMEWEVFRTWVLEGQGWQLHRLWTPHFFRDRSGCIDAIVKEAFDLVAGEQDKDGLKVVNEDEPYR